ncbi:HisA/HisF-related TIM barrel protein [Rubripirellula sp.]|nr:HisA/HisF-related TIM barrel protein [Rubripirellula sp.]
MPMSSSVSVIRWRDHLIGVIDVKDSLAVHGVAGKRVDYQPVSFCDGCIVGLAKHYFDQGIRSLYVADLNALEGAEIQWSELASLAEFGFQRVMVDVGWRSSMMEFKKQFDWFSNQYSQIQWIVATESCDSVSTIDALLEWVTPERVCVSLDFSSGEFLSDLGSWSYWVEQIDKRSIRDLIVLDVATVGTQRGVSTVGICRQIRSQWPTMRICTGGGVRFDADVDLLIDAGCDGVLAATSLFPDT